MSLFDLSGVVLQLSNHTVTVQRFSADTYDTNGYAQPRASVAFTTRASVQPISGKELERLPDGTNTTAYVSIWTKVALQPRDRVFVPTMGSFEVEHLDGWTASGNYTKAIAKALDDAEPRA